jgi:hypothetical protein
VGPETQQERQLRQAEAVFTGRVTRVVDPRAGSALLRTVDPVVATIAVTDVSKGDLGSGPFNAGLCGGSEQVAGDALPRSRAPTDPARVGRGRQELPSSERTIATPYQQRPFPATLKPLRM